MIFVEVEFTERNNRFFRNQCKSQSIPFSTSSNQRTGIDSKQHTGFPLFVLIFCSSSASRLRISPVRIVEKENWGFFGPLITPARRFIRVVSCLTVKKTVSSCKVSTFKAWMAALAVDSPIGSSAEISWKHHGTIYSSLPYSMPTDSPFLPKKRK